MNMPQLWPSPDSLHVLILLVPLLATLGHCGDPYSLSQVLFCQPSEPRSGLLKMFNEDQMFSYNFNDNSVSPWIKDFDQWRSLAFPDPSTISFHMTLCNRFREDLTSTLLNFTPEARGVTHVTVFTAHPLRIGVQNTLICAINDVYPPALTITWRKNAEILTRGLNSNKYLAMDDLTFQAFSYLNVTPYHKDVFSCEVQVSGDNRTIIEYWIPKYPVPSELLLVGLCGLGFTLGIISSLLGIILCALAQKLHNTD